eukprot:4614455-Alexandrium_andersonii.AAC.1
MPVNEHNNLHDANASVDTCSTAAHAAQAISIHPDVSRRTSGTTVRGQGTRGKLQGEARSAPSLCSEDTTIGKTG